MLPSLESLRSMLAQDSAHIEELQQLLQTEREHLENRRHNELAQVVEAKNQLLERLGEHSRQRQSWLDEANLSRDQSGWQALLEADNASRDLLEPWQALTERFSQCQQLNDINGKIIGRSRQTLGQLLNIVRGQVAGPQLYNAQGSTASESGSQTIIKA